jgi:prepilin-type N-terminal cleavage/methylation domain-containing protein
MKRDPMKHNSFKTWRRLGGFTLIELLIVISIIAILAGLLFPLAGVVNRNKIKAKARAELAFVIMAIENYKSKLGHYPPDNPVFPARNQLYFELLGTTNVGNGFSTLDGSARILNSEFADAYGNPGINGFVNSSGARGGDEGRVARRFLPDLKPGNEGVIPPRQDVKYLLCSVTWDNPNLASWPLGVAKLNPFRYNSSNPTNNPSTYDLWVDVVIAGKTNRISNWSKEPLIVSVPY